MRKRFYMILFNITLVVFIFMFALSSANPDNKLNKFVSITGNAVKIDNTPGCIKNIFEDDIIVNMLSDKVSDDYYNLVVIKEIGNYYLINYEDGYMKDSFGKRYFSEKGDLICYDFNNLPEWIEI